MLGGVDWARAHTGLAGQVQLAHIDPSQRPANAPFRLQKTVPLDSTRIDLSPSVLLMSSTEFHRVTSNGR
jgi:hypothetical protein